MGRFKLKLILLISLITIVERNKHLQEYYGEYLPTNYV